jgi:hypothetical protein
MTQPRTLAAAIAFLLGTLVIAGLSAGRLVPSVSAADARTFLLYTGGVDGQLDPCG